MHIYYDYQIFALQNIGGISRYFVELAGRLSCSSRNIKTTVLAPLHINEYLASSSVETVGKKIFGFPGKHHVLSPVNRIAGTILLKSLTPDIFHETYYSKHLQPVRAPRVLTVYDMIHERFPEQFRGPDVLIPERKAAAVSRADHIIAISHNTRADLIRYLAVPEEKITVIPLASSFNVSQLPPPLNRERHKPYLLYVGLRQGVKNFSTLLGAYAHSKILQNDYDLVCVGGGAFTASELHAIHSAELQKRVRHLQADDRVLEKLYANATVFVYPSLYEGFGLPLLEAMRCGCPVVCSNTGSMPEIAGDAALYFDPDNEEELRMILENTAQSESDRDLLRNRGYQREKLFSWEACVEKTARLYRSLL
jgi:glycosyltransferase involved in cell wall biosynthesis